MKSAVKQCFVFVLLSMTLCFSMLGSAYAQINASNKSGKVTFAGEHLGMKFKGVFEQWQATLILPPNTTPSINAIFDLRSAKTGDSTYDDTLPEGDWFDVENHPQGRFDSTSITQIGNNFKVMGKLTLRGKTLPIEFVLNDVNNTLKASFVIDRLNYAIGLDSDPDAEWVSRSINMTLSIKK